MKLIIGTSIEGRVADRRHRASKTLGPTLTFLLAPYLGLTVTLGACDVTDEASWDDSSKTQDGVKFRDGDEDEDDPTEGDSTNGGDAGGPYKQTFDGTSWRPDFGMNGVPFEMSCPQKTRNIDHTISWLSIRKGYVAALNSAPSDVATCKSNLVELHRAVGINGASANDADIQKACDERELETGATKAPGLTLTDETILSKLNSATPNLRCGHASANQSISEKLDIPCEDQDYDSSSNTITLKGDSKQQIDHLKSISTTLPDHIELTYKVVNQTACSRELRQGSQVPADSKICPNMRLQTSDCSNDHGKCMKDGDANVDL